MYIVLKKGESFTLLLPRTRFWPSVDVLDIDFFQIFRKIISSETINYEQKWNEKFCRKALLWIIPKMNSSASEFFQFFIQN